MLTTCNDCGRESPDDARFCAGCGSRLAGDGDADGDANPVVESVTTSIPNLEGERRIVTILMSDLSGYTSMGERFDPEVVAEVMRTIKQESTEIVESFGGVVNQFIGDEIVSLFGLPAARDDDARRAVLAALALHERVTDLGEAFAGGADHVLSMHSGIQTGLLIARVDDERNGMYELTGDAINTAARLLSLADSGDVVIGDETKRLVEGLVEVDDVGHHEVRGKARPISAFRVVSASPDRSRFDASEDNGLTPFTGRDSEVSMLLDSARSAFLERGSAVVVEGEAGSGKSRLCHEFLRRLRLRYPDARGVAGPLPDLWIDHAVPSVRAVGSGSARYRAQHADGGVTRGDARCRRPPRTWAGCQHPGLPLPPLGADGGRTPARVAGRPAARDLAARMRRPRARGVLDETVRREAG